MEIPDSRHDLIQLNVMTAVRAHLNSGGGQVASRLANHRLRPAPNRYIHADLALALGAADFTDTNVDTPATADAFIEISSPGTWEHDHVTKGELFRQLPACREYWIIRTEDFKAEHWTRMGPNQWKVRFIGYELKANFTLACAPVEFPLAHAYRGTTLAEQP